MQPLSDQKILDSWEKNVSEWTRAIQEKQIRSRNLVTDQAIINEIISSPGKNVLDIGCGEGWLTRALTAQDYSVTGIDATAGLVNQAKQLGPGRFQVIKYEDISLNSLNEKYDIAVCNFSLLGKESVEHIFKVLPDILNKAGRVIIQTLHPMINCDDAPYADGWRKGSWEGFSKDFIDPAPWYFRTLESWIELFVSNGFVIQKIKEPTDPDTARVASLLIVSSLAP